MWNFQGQLLTIAITTFIIVFCSVLFFFKVKKLKANEAPTGLVLVIEKFVGWVEELVVDVMGYKFRWFTPYIIFLMTYIGIGNLLGLFGLSPMMASYTICFSLGVFTFIGIFATGFKFQKLSFLKRYVHNPLDIVLQFAPFISLTFRIFGNTVAGGVIVYLIYTFSRWILNINFKNTPIFEFMRSTPNSEDFTLNVLAGLMAPPFHIYFDIFDGLIQTFIFALLTMSYIGLEAEGHEEKKAVSENEELSASKDNKNIKTVEART